MAKDKKKKPAPKVTASVKAKVSPKAKPLKKAAKPIAKAKSAPPAKAAKAAKPAKPVKNAKVPSQEAPGKAKFGKPSEKQKANVQAQAEAFEPKPMKAEKFQKPVVDKPEKKAKVSKSAEKGRKKEVEEDDDFLPEIEAGAEELPDLSEFEEEPEVEEIEDVSLEALDVKPATDSDEEIILTDAEGRRYCKVKDCDQIAAVEGYCRFHYLLLWKRIQVRRKILVDGKLERYVEELTARYPDKFLEMIRRDLKTDKDFLQAIAELEIDESSGEGDFEEETQNYIDEVRGVSGETSLAEEEEF